MPAATPADSDYWRHVMVRRKVMPKALSIYRSVRRGMESAGRDAMQAHMDALAELYARARGTPWGKEPSESPNVDGPAEVPEQSPILDIDRVRAAIAKRRDNCRDLAVDAYDQVVRMRLADGEDRQAAHEEGVAEVYAQGRYASRARQMRRVQQVMQQPDNAG